MISLARVYFSKSLKLQSINLILILPLVFMTCSENDPEPLVEFELSITGPSTDLYTIGVVDITAVASVPDITIASAKIFIDNILLVELTSSTIKTSWNSTNVADGTHTIKVIALATNGKQSTDELNVEVLNSFITMNIPSNYVLDGENKIFFFSNQDGDVLAVAEPENDSELIIETPSTLKPGDEIVFSIFRQETFIEYIESYSDFKPGIYNLKVLRRYNETGIGMHQINVTDVPTSASYWRVSSNNIITNNFLFSGSSDISIDAQFSVSPTNVFLNQHKDGMLGFSGLLLKNLSLGENTTISLSEFTPMILQEANSAVDATFSLSVVEGLVDANDDYSNVRVWVDMSMIEGAGDPKKFRMFYPGSVFPKYVFDNIYHTPSYTYRTQEIGVEPPSSVAVLEANLTSVKQENSILTISTTGTCDFTSFQASAYTAGQRTIVWEMYVPSGENRTVRIPNIPDEIKAITSGPFESLVFEKGVLTDYGTLDGYQACLQFFFNSPDKLFLPLKTKNPI